MDQDLLDTMRTAGVAIEKYHPPKWYTLHKLNNRTHRKLLVVDGRIGFTGAWNRRRMGRQLRRIRTIARDKRIFGIEGPAVAQCRPRFIDNWSRSTGVVLDGSDLSACGNVGRQCYRQCSRARAKAARRACS
jgi:cardiolipin synthase